MCRRGNKHFDVHFRRIRLVLFPSKNGKNAACERRKGWKRFYFLPESAFFVFIANMMKVIFPICTLTWRVNNYVSRQGKGIYRRNEIIIIVMIIVYHGTILIEFFGPSRLTTID